MKHFAPKVSKTVTMTNRNERDDLSQELHLLLMKCVKVYDINAVPGFWEFRDQYKSVQKEKEKS